MNNCTWDFQGVLNRRADAFARIRGSDDYPEIQGIVRFYQTNRGVIVSANVSGLPTDGSKPCEERVFGFHVHMGESCTGNEKDPFSDTLSHYNPHNCLHPMHAGDLPPLFENAGRAFRCSRNAGRFQNSAVRRFGNENCLRSCCKSMKIRRT